MKTAGSKRKRKITATRIQSSKANNNQARCFPLYSSQSTPSDSSTKCGATCSANNALHIRRCVTAEGRRQTVLHAARALTMQITIRFPINILLQIAPTCGLHAAAACFDAIPMPPSQQQPPAHASPSSSPGSRKPIFLGCSPVPKQLVQAQSPEPRQ